MRRVLLALSVLLVLGLVAGYWYARPLLLTGTGYAAHNACALEHLAGRDDAATDLPPNPLVPVLSSSVDDDGASAGVLGVLARQRATYRPGYGCTVGETSVELAEPADVEATNPLLRADVAAPGLDDAPAVDAAMDAAFGAEGTRAVLVLRGGELVAERYAPGFDAGTRQLGWSLTKSLTNLVTGRLVQQGLVEEGRDDLLAAWAGDDRSRITVRQLEQMTAGLEWDETYDLGTPITRMLYLEPDMAGYVAQQPLAHQPGSHLQYSSGSTNLLCRALADATGRQGAAAADLVREELFAPMGTSSAIVEVDGAGTPVCASYGWAVPRDWAAFGQLALDDGVWQGERLVPEGWVEASTTPVRLEDPAENEDPGYAAGWWANERPDGSLTWPEMPADTFTGLGHDGQWLTVVPSADLVVVRLGFSPEPGDEGVPTLVQDLVAAYGD